MPSAKLDVSLSATILSSRRLKDGERFVRSGSALLRVGSQLLAIQDDACELSWIDPLSPALRFVPLVGDGKMLPKSQKPDFEAAFYSPSHGRIFILGSGSAPARRGIMHLHCIDNKIDLIDHLFESVDAGPLFDALEEALGTVPNIEGAALLGADSVRLFHRGSGRGELASAYLDVPIQTLYGQACEPPAVHGCSLGDIGGVALSFTDAANVGEGRILYAAAAEDTADAIADGPVAGAALGVMDEEGGLRYTLLRYSDGSAAALKVEGIAADHDGRFAYLISDPDDASLAAELFRVELSGPWLR